jgi:hypothetical protein
MTTLIISNLDLAAISSGIGAFIILASLAPLLNNKRAKLTFFVTGLTIIIVSGYTFSKKISGGVKITIENIEKI